MCKKEVKSRILLGLVFFILLMLLSAWLNINNYLYDAKYYWTTGESVVKNGGVHLIDYPKTYRGCYLPLIMALLRRFWGDGSWTWRVFINLLVSVEYAFILPTLFDNCISEKKKLIGSCLSLLVFVWLWGNYLQYPLSDFIAFFFFTTATVMIKKALQEKRALYVILYGITCGMFLYLAYNTRVVFLWGGVLLVLNATLYSFLSKNMRRFLLTVLAVGVAIVITALPQMIVNKNQEGKYSPRVYTENFGSAAKLEYQQILWGITYPRYETTIRMDEWGKPQMLWVDPAGTELVSRNNIHEEKFGKKAYLGLCLRNPVDIAAVYVRHFVSVTTPIFTQVLVTDLHIDRTFILVAIVTLWFIAGVSVIENIKCRRFHSAGWILSTILPSIMQMLGAVEIRFFLPMHVLLIYYVCAVVDYRELNSKTKNRRLELVIAFVVIFMLWTAVYSDLLAMNSDAVFLIND